jgi:DNA repair protein RecO (recombination protein O)
MTRVVDEPGIVLHSRPYRENSLIVTVFTMTEGRVSMVAKGVRGGRRGRALQPFTVARLGWSGRTSLGTLTGFEPEAQYWYQGNVLACAFYLAELLVRLVAEREPHPRLYAGLAWSLEHLDRRPTAVLRSFEKLLLEELGYGLDFGRDVNGELIAEDRRYRLVVDEGFFPEERGVSGAALQAIAEDDYASESVRQAAKSIFREALAHHLGPRPLTSRQLLVTPES